MKDLHTLPTFTGEDVFHVVVESDVHLAPAGARRGVSLRLGLRAKALLYALRR
jgi:hypothetical protein